MLRTIAKNVHLRLVLLRGNLLRGLRGLGLTSSLTLSTLALHVLIINAHSLVNLGAQGILFVKPDDSELVYLIRWG